MYKFINIAQNISKCNVRVLSGQIFESSFLIPESHQLITDKKSVPLSMYFFIKIA